MRDGAGDRQVESQRPEWGQERERTPGQCVLAEAERAHVIGDDAKAQEIADDHEDLGDEGRCVVPTAVAGAPMVHPVDSARMVTWIIAGLHRSQRRAPRHRYGARPIQRPGYETAPPRSAAPERTADGAAARSPGHRSSSQRPTMTFQL